MLQQFLQLVNIIYEETTKTWSSTTIEIDLIREIRLGKESRVDSQAYGEVDIDYPLRNARHA